MSAWGGVSAKNRELSIASGVARELIQRSVGSVVPSRIGVCSANGQDAKLKGIEWGIR